MSIQIVHSYDFGKVDKKPPSAKMYVTSRFLELEAHIFIVFCSDAETFKNALFRQDFENRSPSIWVPQASKIRKYFIDNISVNFLVGLGYPYGWVPIFKILTKECIFERFSI